MIEMNKHLIVSAIAVLLICVGLSGCTDFGEQELKVTILNTSNEKMKVELYIFIGPDFDSRFTVQYKTLEHNESVVFNLKFDKTDSIYMVDIRAINHTYYIHPETHKKYTLSDGTEYGIVRYNGHVNYSFSDGKLHNLLAVITPAYWKLNTSNFSGNLKYNIQDTNLNPIDITIVQMPEAGKPIKVDF